MVADLIRIVKRGDDKSRWDLTGRIQRRRHKNDVRIGLLIHIHLDDLHFIEATAMILLNVHPAFRTLIALRLEEVQRGETIHAVMKIHHYPGSDCQVTDKRYGCDRIFHEPATKIAER